MALAEAAKDAAAGKDDEQSPRHGNAPGRRPARRSSGPTKQVCGPYLFRLPCCSRTRIATVAVPEYTLP